MHRLRCVVVIGALAVAVCVVGAGPAFAAKGGNDGIAKACQKSGWQGLGTFANQGDCVNDGAQGRPPSLGSAGQTACQAINGIFTLHRPPTWMCQYTPNPVDEAPNDENTTALNTACGADHGDFGASQKPGSFTVWVANCVIH